MIKLTGINKIYRTNEIETVALENVNLEVNKGEFLSIMGPSGCGKSTLLNIMGLLDAPTSGTIEIAGTKVDGMKDKELAAFRNRKLGFVFQSFHLINSLNVLDNVELPLLYRKVSAKERRRLAEEVLQKVGLIGTFWFRTRRRRNEIALRLAMGSTKKQIFCLLMGEGLLLLTLVALPAMLVCYNVGVAEFIMGHTELITTWPVEWSFLRFLLGSLGAWLLIALMVVTGIWFPAQQAIDIQPAEALHEE